MWREVDWAAVLEAEGERVGSVVGGAMAPRSGINTHADDPRQAEDQDEDRMGDEESDGQGVGIEQGPEFLTIGLIGESFQLPHCGGSALRP